LIYSPKIVKNTMKTFFTAMLLVFIIGNIGAVDTESYQFIDHLRAISTPGKPEIYEDGVIFTMSSSYQRVGISFAHEGYSRVHWFRRLMVPRNPDEFAAAGKNAKYLDPNVDSGIMLPLETIPPDITNMDYRLIVNGLWTADPLNPEAVTGSSGIVASRVPLPEKPKTAPVARPGTYRFSFNAPPGETVTVGGSFNNWDPFMYELRETRSGFYTLTRPLPPGSFQYVFFHRGEEIPDPVNTRRIYLKNGRIVTEASVD
jgi:hypothetical protein